MYKLCMIYWPMGLELWKVCQDRSCVYTSTWLIGASLNEPHTSGTALWKCVKIHACLLACLRSYTVNFKCAFKYFPKIERPRALCAGLLPECSVCNFSGDGSSLTPTVPYILFVTVPTDRPSTADYSDRTKLYMPSWKSLQVRVVHKRHS